jgi:penicillin amidase
MLVDFSDKEKRTWGILPVGNSGNPKSIFYQDQAKMYNEGKMRRQLTNKKEIQRTSSLLLLKVK